MEQLEIKVISEENITAAAALMLGAYDGISERFGLRSGADVEKLTDTIKRHLENRGVLFGGYAGSDLAGTFLLIPRDEGVYELTMLCVSPSFQKKGYGSALLKEAESAALDNEGFALICAIIDKYTELKSMLLRAGFEESVCGAYAGYPCDICVMRKKIAGIIPKTPDYDISDGNRVTHFHGGGNPPA